MLSVTDAAVKELSGLLDQTEAASSQCIRLIQQDDALALQVDEPQEGDQVVADDDRPVLLVDADLASALQGATLDAVDTQDGTQLMIVGAGNELDPAANNGSR
jgi:Fe-S cluster assembly iron-binding protein IscA